MTNKDYSVVLSDAQNMKWTILIISEFLGGNLAESLVEQGKRTGAGGLITVESRNVAEGTNIGHKALNWLEVEKVIIYLWEKFMGKVSICLYLHKNCISV